MTLVVDSKETDLSGIAECHRRAFPASLSSAMGPPFLKQMLSWYLTNDHAFLFHVEADGRVVGYCGGVIVDGTQATGSASGMAQHSFKSAIASFFRKPWLLFHTEVRKKYKLIFRNFLLKFKLVKAIPKRVTGTIDNSTHIGLVVIGVDPAFQGKGYATMLLQEFEMKGRKLEVESLRLTVLPGNIRAIETYKKNGWNELSQSMHSMSMIKIISK